MTVTEAKARLLELGRTSNSGGLFGNPLVRTGGLLLAGALLGRLTGKRAKEGGGRSDWLRTLAMQAVAAAGPTLVEQLVQILNTHRKQEPAAPDRPAAD